MWNRLHSGWLGSVLLMASLAVAQPPPQSADSWTLEEAIEQALVRNRDLVKGAMELQSYRLAEEEALEATRGVLIVPEGTGQTGSDYSEARVGLRVEKTASYGTRVGVVGAVRQIEVEGIPTQHRGEVRVEISQPLFRQFGPLMQNEPIVSANENWMAARRAWERERSALVVRVVELFEGLINLRHQIDSDEAFAVRMEKLWLLADAREQQGKSTRTEVMRMDLQRGKAAARLEVERAQLGILYQEFANLLGLPLDTAFQLVPPPLLNLDVQDPDRALNVALKERPDYAQALQDIATGERHLKRARRSLLPDLRLVGRQTTYGEGEEWSDAGRFDEDDWFVGLAADMNVNLRGAHLEVARSDIDVEARRQTAEIVRYRLAVEVNSALSVYHRTRAELELATRNRELAANRAELSRALFEAGRATADSVSDAESDTVKAQLQELKARQDSSVSAYRLLDTLGTLVPTPRELLWNE
jgi:outer membrane protein TolC